MVSHFVVTAKAVQADTRSGTTVLLLCGALLPEDVKPAQLEHLLALEMVEERPGLFVGGLQ